MTREQILEQLDAAGYVVARRAYRDAVHAMHPKRGAGTWNKAELVGRQYSIDLATARWNRWGDDGLWHPLGELPHLTNESETTRSLAQMIGASEATFVGECVKRGFVLDDNLQRSIDHGNRFARWTDGRRHLIHESAGRITDCLTGQSRSLDEFLVAPWEVVQASPPPSLPPPRPFVSMRERPLHMQGARVQTSLF